MKKQMVLERALGPAAGRRAWSVWIVLALVRAGSAGRGRMVALWLLLTRTGRLALAATRIGIASLPQRWGASSVIIVGIAGVVGVLVAMLAMGEGFAATLKQTGSDDTAIILRGGSQAETNSVITRDQVSADRPRCPASRKDAQGRAIISPELSQVVNLPTAQQRRRRATRNCAASARRRGRSARRSRSIEGRKFNVGVREVVVGQGAQSQYRGLELGKPIKLGNQTGRWSACSLPAMRIDSELWTDIETLVLGLRPARLPVGHRRAERQGRLQGAARPRWTATRA